MSVARDFIVLFLGSGPSVSVEILFKLPEGFVSGSLVSLDVIVCGLLLGSKIFIRCSLGFCIRFTWPEGYPRLFLVLFYFLV